MSVHVKFAKKKTLLNSIVLINLENYDKVHDGWYSPS